MEPTVKPRERGELQLQFQTEDRNFCLSVTAKKLFELSGLRMVEEKYGGVTAFCVPPNTGH